MHCHLDLYSDPKSIVESCKQKGLYALSVTTTPKAWLGTQRLALGYPKIKTALGLHPELAHLRINELDIFDMLFPQSKYIGEIGLDGSNEYKSFYKEQLKVFHHILSKVNRDGGRLMSIHSRKAVLEILSELKSIDGIPILHWFSGSKNELQQAIQQGCWFSVGPAMIKGQNGREIISIIPRDKILTETDGPFGTYNKKSLMPWDVNKLYPFLSGLWNISILEVEKIIEMNFRKIISLL